MKTIKMTILIAQVLLLFSLPVRGDMFANSPICSKPFKPFEFNSQSEIDQF